VSELKPALRLPWPWHKAVTMMDHQGHHYDWKLGARCVDRDEDDWACDGIGGIHIQEVGRYTPPGFGQRVFFTQQFEKPNGERVGKPKLKVIGAGAFTRHCRGYRYPFHLTDELKDVRMMEHIDIEDMADAVSY
jgi:hypothetical protein